jgi:hypothetical protein
MTTFEKLRNDTQRRRTILGNDRGNQRSHLFLGNRPQKGSQIAVADCLSAERDRLIEKAQAVSHATFTGSGNDGQAAVVNENPILLRHVTQTADDF